MNKKKLLLLTVILVLVLSLGLVACDNNETITYGEWEIVNLPTDTAEGVIKRTGSDGKEYTFTLPVLTSENYTKNEVLPTCETDGKVTYTIKAVDKDYSFDITLPKLNHDWNEPTYEWNSDYSTCTATRVCSRDASHIETLQGIITKVKIDSTCTEGGSITYTATFDKDWATTQTMVVTVDKLEHSWNATTYEWSEDFMSCTAKRVCSRDSSHIETSLANVTKEVIDATCTEAGSITYTATFYEDWATTQTKVITLDAIGHKWSSEVKYVWNGSECKATRSCNNDALHVETITANVTIKRVEPTFDADGYVTYTATFDKDWAEPQTNKKVLPKYTLQKIQGVPATCLEEGRKEYYKGTDGKYYTDGTSFVEITEPIDTWKIEPKVALENVPRVEPTFDSKGRIEHWKCPKCGKLYSTSEATFNNEIKDKNKLNIAQYTLTYINGEAPTCTETGLKEYWAGSNGVNYADANHTTPIDDLATWRVIEPLGHDWYAPYYTWYTDDKDNIACIAYRDCQRNNCACNESATATNITSEVTLEPTFDTKGKMKYTATFTEEWAKGTEPITEVVDIPPYTLSRVEKVWPTVNDFGSKEYYLGSNGKYYTDATHTEEITNLDNWKKIDKIPVTKVDKIEPEYGVKGQKEFYYETNKDTKKYYLGADGRYTPIPSDADLVIEELPGTVTIYVNDILQETTISHKKSEDITEKSIKDVIGVVDYAEIFCYEDNAKATLIANITEYCRASQNVTVYVYKVYAITFDANGGNPVEGFIKEYGRTYGKLADATYTGFTFNGWYKENGEPVRAEDVIEPKAHTLTANWYTEGLEFTANANYLSVSNYNGSSTDIIIPSRVVSMDNKIVKEIGVAFSGNKNIMTVSLPDTIKKICNDAFASCDKLTHINIPKHIEYIGDYAFSHAAIIDDIVIPATLTYIGYYALDMNTVPNYRVDINNKYFTSRDIDGKECNVIMYNNDTPYVDGEFRIEKGYIIATTGEATIPSSANTIMLSNFSGKSLTIPSNIKTILEDGISFTNLTSIIWQDTDGAKIAIGGITNNINLTYIRLPKGLVSIDDNGLSNNSFLENIVIPSTVTTLGSDVFDGNYSLTSIYLEHSTMPNWSGLLITDADIYLYSESEPTLDMWETGALYWHYINSNPTPWAVPEFTITYNDVDDVLNTNPTSYKPTEEYNLPYAPSAPGYVFDGWYTEDGRYFTTSIKKGTIGNLVLTPMLIDENFTIEDNGDYATFTKYSGSKTFVTIPSFYKGKNLTHIGAGAFENNTTLANVVIGKYVTSIDATAFAGTSSLTNIYLDMAMMPLFVEGWNNNATYYLYSETEPTLEMWQSGNKYWHYVGEYHDEIAIWKDMYAVELNADGESYKLTGYNGKAVDIAVPSAYMNKPITVIAGNAFRSTAIQSITIPSSVKTIETLAFDSCKQLTSVIFEDLTTTIDIENHTFIYCEKLETLILPKVNNLLENAFANSPKLTIFFSDAKPGVNWNANWNRDNNVAIFGYDATTTTTYSFQNGNGEKVLEPIETTGIIKLPSVSELTIPAGYTFTGWYTDKECTLANKLNGYYFSKTPATLYAGIVTADGLDGLSVATAKILTLGVPRTEYIYVNANAEGGQFFKFVPAESGDYTFRSTSGTYFATIAFSSGTNPGDGDSPIASDNTSGNNPDFNIKMKLEAGKTYYIFVGPTKSSTTDTVTFLIE